MEEEYLEESLEQNDEVPVEDAKTRMRRIRAKLGPYVPRCYVCLDDTKELLSIMTKKFILRLYNFNLHILQNSATPIHICEPCKTEINDSIELLERVKNGRHFWANYSERMGIRVTDPTLVKGRKRKKDDPVPSLPREVLKLAKKRALNDDEKLRISYMKFYNCTQCMGKFHSQLALSIHSFDAHFKNVEDPARCTDCDLVLKSEDKCRTHYMRLHHNANLVCDVCGESGLTKARLKYHLKSQHNMRLKIRTNTVAEFMAATRMERKKLQQGVNVVKMEPKIQPAEIESDGDDIIEEDGNDFAEDDSQEFQTYDPPSPAVCEEVMETDEPEIVVQSTSMAKHINSQSMLSASHSFGSSNGVDSPNEKKCSLCDEVFPINADTRYYLHVWTDHGRQIDLPLVCRVCNKEFAHEDLCRRHFLANHFEQNKACELCFKTGMSYIQYRYHMKYCTKRHQVNKEISGQPQATVKCEYCQHEFKENDKVPLFHHVWKNHVRVVDAPEVCAICQKNCENEINCRGHFFNMHYDKSHVCYLCKTGNFTKAEILEHRRTVHSTQMEKKKANKNNKNPEQFMQPCAFCNEMFRNSTSEWGDHIWTVHGRNNENPDKCKECNKTFKSEFYTRKHFINHHYNKVQICEECGKGNMTKRELFSHIKNHRMTDSHKKVQCKVCSRYLANAESYEKHMEFHRNQNLKRTFRCDMCGASYPSQQSLTMHTNAVHLKTPTHLCRYCERGFYSVSTRRAHEVAIHTKLYGFKCGFCGHQTAQISRIRQHIKAQHLKEPVTKDEIDVKYVIRQNGTENSRIYQRKVERIRAQDPGPYEVEESY